LSDFGCVYLVGAGPGDPELLTVKALRLLGEADVVVYDRLVSPAILELIPAGTTRIFVGKAAGNHHLPQDEINTLLASLARSRGKVVRLKGGDPFVFGRGSEEALHLRRHGIRFEVVPGITTATAISAETGIPLTHRGLAGGVRFVTGHARNDLELDIDWSKTADKDTTLVIYMGLTNIGEITGNLIAAGLPPETPAAAIASGTLDHQRQCVTRLADLPQTLVDLDFKPPVLSIIGRVAGLAGALNWRELAYERDEGISEQQTGHG